MPVPTPDNVLLARMRVGDRRAWKQLHERYYLTLYATALGMHHDAMATETVVQDVFEEAWENAQLYRAEVFGSVQGWLQELLRLKEGTFVIRPSPHFGISAISAEG